MASSSSATQPVPEPEILPIIPCPLCGLEVVTFVCRKGKRLGVRFYKCCKFTDGLCRFFKWQDEYADTLLDIQILHAPGVQAPDLLFHQAVLPSAPPQAFVEPVLKDESEAPLQDAATEKVHTAISSPAPSPLLSSADDVARISLIVSVMNLLGTALVIGLVLACLLSHKMWWIQVRFKSVSVGGSDSV